MKATTRANACGRTAMVGAVEGMADAAAEATQEEAIRVVADAAATADPGKAMKTVSGWRTSWILRTR